MNWIKKGLIYEVDKDQWWSRKYAMYPTPFFLETENKIRVYFGTVDDNMFGRTSFIDLDAHDPSIIKYNPNNFILDIGQPGTFDDCGVCPASVIEINKKQHLYYSGFCRSFQTPYHIFSGLAVENAEGNFQRLSDTPVLDRTPNEYFDKGGPVVLQEDGLFKTWYVSGLSWELMNSSLYTNKKMPVHTIRYGESLDGIKWTTYPENSIEFADEEEFGFGRPWVIKENDVYKMWYSIRNRNKPYKLGYAESGDGIKWQRKDEEVNIPISENGWDSQMICYAAVLKVHSRIFMFYNGNNHGETGFGYAELINN